MPHRTEPVPSGKLVEPATFDGAAVIAMIDHYRSVAMDTTHAADADLLASVVRRLPMIEALQSGPLCREELQRRLDVSSPTVYRYANWLEERGLIEESSEGLALTAAGETTAEAVSRFETTVQRTLQQPESGRDLLLGIIRHAPGLDSLSDGPRDRREIERELDVSKTTGYRITRSLENLGLIEKTGGRYALTAAGEVVRAAAATLETTVETATRVGPVLEAVREITPTLDPGALAGATVTTPDRGDVYSLVNRFIALVDGTDLLRGVDVDSIAPLYIKDLRQRLVDGMKLEVVLRPRVVATILAELPDEVLDACRSGNVDPYLHGDPPCSVAIFDDRVAIGAREGDETTFPICVDTDSPAVREWAETVFESARDEAVPMEEFSPWSLQRAMERESFDAAEAVDL